MVNTRKMFEMAYKNGYAIGAFNVNNMEITQGIIEAVPKRRLLLFCRYPGEHASTRRTAI